MALLLDCGSFDYSRALRAHTMFEGVHSCSELKQSWCAPCGVINFRLRPNTMRLPAFEFAQAVDSAIASVPREDYHLRRGRAKRLLEELYPLSRFALHLAHPGSRIEVEALEGDGP